MKRPWKYLTCVLTSAAVIALFFLVSILNEQEEKVIKAGYIYVGDASTAYTKNFIKAQDAIEEKYGDRVTNIAKYNTAEGNELEAIRELAEEGCDIIFGTSFGYGATMKQMAAEYPQIQFCQATSANAGEAPVLPNYHTFMGHIYEGRYVSGVVAGMKLREMLRDGIITSEEALVGYVAAFPYAEVISGYTAFFLGVRSCCPDAQMNVLYTNSWSDYTLEKKYAEQLIEEGCVVIAQHSDTAGPAVACENAASGKPVYHVSYNQSMIDVAPTSSLVGCRINWAPYMVTAVGAMLDGRPIEKTFGSGVQINGCDAGAGFRCGWIEILDLNQIIAAEGTAAQVRNCIDLFSKGKMSVFKGDYIGIDPFDESDRYDLNTEYIENAAASAPSFHYVLQDVIHIEE